MTTRDILPLPETLTTAELTETPKRTFISIDLETTGLRPEKHGICQIGAYATGEDEDDFKGYFFSDCNPHVALNDGSYKPVVVDQSALDVNGFDRARIESARALVEVEHEFHRWLNKWQNPVMVCQNTPFDIGWLQRDFTRLGLDCIIFRRTLDTCSLGFALFGVVEGQNKLANRLGIRNGGEHDALSDAIVNSKLFHRLRCELIGRRTPLD